MVVKGHVAPGFERIRAAFSSCFADELEQGAAVAVTLDGRIVADLWGGTADDAPGRAWQADTIVNIWSVSKAILALAVAMAVERGQLRYDRPVADVWPEFAAAGKSAITLETILTHRSGLTGLSTPMDLAGLYAWHPYVEALAAMAPLWEPGSRCTYNALSFGHLAGEALRRATGKTVGAFLRDEIASPLGLSLFIGLPESEEGRVAHLIEGPGASDWVAQLLAGPYPHACINPFLTATEPNDRAWRAAEIPACNAHSDARSLARLFGGLAGGRSDLISPEGLAEATRIRFEGVDTSFGSPAVYGAGFSIRNAEFGRHASKSAFGHTGWGGSMAFADPEAKVGFAYVTRYLLGFDDVDPRHERLTAALYEAL